MIYPMSLSMMFESVGLAYGLTLPVIVLILFCLLALPAVFRPSARAEFIAYAAYCYVAQMLGILLMTAGGLPALYAVFAQQALSEMTYVGLLIVFGTGGLLYLWHDSRLRLVDSASKAIPGALFLITWKFIGLIVTLFAGLSLVLRLMLVAEQAPNWWVNHMIMLLYGLILSWFTLRHPVLTSHPVPAAPVRPVTIPVKSVPASAKKPVSAKPKGKK